MRPSLAASLLVCLLAVSALSARQAVAVVISTGDGTGNTTAPPDDPGFANVGRSSNNLTGVYLGNRWVLTAAHVGERDFTFDGIFYEAVPGSRVVIDKGGTAADLAMVRLSGPPPPLPDLVLATAPIAVGEVATMIGNGWNREPNLTCWNVNWTELTCPAGVFNGYERLGSQRVLRWGSNEITDVDLDVAGSGTDTRSFSALFDEAGEPHEAQVVNGDSGGGVFVKRGGQWELVGIHIAMGVFMSQPSQTVVFGNRTYATDVYYYKPEIEAILATPVHVPLVPWPALLLLGGVVLGAARRALPRR
ncbi:MAG: trypsin-like serine protease [Myxococcota bacterium]